MVDGRRALKAYKVITDGSGSSPGENGSEVIPSKFLSELAAVADGRI